MNNKIELEIRKQYLKDMNFDAMTLKEWYNKNPILLLFCFAISPLLTIIFLIGKTIDIIRRN